MQTLNTIYNVDCLEGMKRLSDCSIDACVTDPPYGWRFMGQKWDYEIPVVAIWKEVLRVLKPGAHLLCACGTRTQHRMAVNIEDAGFEIRDVICWHYGQGFPKSVDIGKALDKSAGVSRRILRIPSGPNGAKYDGERYKEKRLTKFGIVQDQPDKTVPVTEEAKRWDGWGTSLKPATELWTLARKPLGEKTVAGNVIRYGTGGLNIDACRVGEEERTYGLKGGENLNRLSRPNGNDIGDARGLGAYGIGAKQITIGERTVSGRFPANLILDEFMAAEMDRQTGILSSGRPAGVRKASNKIFGQYAPGMDVTGYGDSGGGSRFFYVAKADTAERGPGNTHTTVKPLALMHYLIKLICPIEPGRIVLDCFAGSGTTCIAARMLGIDFIAYELDAGHVRIAENRLRNELGLFY